MNEFVRKYQRALGYYTRDIEQRPGQARMNALRKVDPELYEMIAGTPADCFYDDSKIPAFERELFGEFVTNP